MTLKRERQRKPKRSLKKELQLKAALISRPDVGGEGGVSFNFLRIQTVQHDLAMAHD